MASNNCARPGSDTEANVHTAKHVKVRNWVPKSGKQCTKVLQKIRQEGKYFFSAPTNYDEKTIRKKWDKNTSRYIKELKANLSRMSDFSSERIEEEFKKYIKEQQLLMGKLLPVFRVCLTGVGIGPSIFEIASLLGQQEVVLRMEKALNTIK